MQNPTLKKLNNHTLPELAEGILRPSYDRSKLSAGIVHIGVGNFHRAHQSWYLHRLMQQGLAHDWAIVGAGVREFDTTQRTKLAAQDYLTTLIELDPSGRSAEVVGSMIDYVPITDGHAALIERMAQPDIRIVALTVTESGYFIDTANGTFDAAHPDIRHDALNPEQPRTAFGAMIAALSRRRDQNLGPFTCQSCDNLRGNGDVLRQTLVSLARLSNPDLADWIDQQCSFPASMVDCIVPATGPREIAVAQDFGIDDAAPVTHENYRQWVLEDDFCAGRPPWEKAGVTLTTAVHDYEMMKIRILNGGHQVISTPGELLSVNTINECMAHPLIGALFRKVATEEVAPHVAAVAEMTPVAYIDLIEKRFANPEIGDTVRRVAFDGSSRHSTFILPVVRDAIAAGAPCHGLALIEALWARMCFGSREDGSLIEANDPIWEELNTAAKQARETPLSWLDQSRLYGDLNQEAVFAKAFEYWLKRIWSEGTEPAIQHYLNGQSE